MFVQKSFFLLLIFSFVLVNYSLEAQTSKTINVVTTAVPFLRMSADSRAGGMGEVGIATSPDANSIFWNIGKVPFAKTIGGLMINYSPWLKNWTNDTYLASLAGYYKFGENEAIHGSIQYFNLGDIQFKDNNGNYLQSFHPREFGMSMGYSRKLGNIGIGVGLKYINSNLANKSADGNEYKAGTAAAADIGFYYDSKNGESDGWAIGVALTNLGSKISYTNAEEKNFLPANLGLGTSYTKMFDNENKVCLGMDFNKLLVPTPPITADPLTLAAYRNKGVTGSWISSFSDAPGGLNEELKEIQISVGLEYSYKDQFTLRAGYFYENKTKGNRNYFTIGTGIKYNKIGLNFSWSAPSNNSMQSNPLNNTLRFGLTFDFKE